MNQIIDFKGYTNSKANVNNSNSNYNDYLKNKKYKMLFIIFSATALLFLTILFIKIFMDNKNEEIAKKLGVSAEEVAAAMDAFLPVESIYQSSYTNEEGAINIIDTLSTQVDESNTITNRLSIRALIDELEEKEKELIVLRYYQGKTQMQVAEILGITQVQVSRIEKRILSSMRMKLVT